VALNSFETPIIGHVLLGEIALSDKKTDPNTLTILAAKESHKR
jgi:hypothetical protein